jgi:hypothetical protein
MRYTAALPFFALALGLVAFLPAYGTVLARTLSHVAPLLIGALFCGFLVRAVVVARSPPVAKLDAASAPCKVADPRAHHQHMAEVHQAHSARSPLQQALDSPFMQAGVLLLIFSDVATTLCELMLSEVCPAPPHGSRAAHHLEGWEGRLAWTGRAMLGVLMLHQLSLLYAYGAEFWHHKMHVLDFVICCVAVGLEAFELLKGEGAQHAGEGDNKDEALCVRPAARRPAAAFRCAAPFTTRHPTPSRQSHDNAGLARSESAPRVFRAYLGGQNGASPPLSLTRGPTPRANPAFQNRCTRTSTWRCRTTRGSCT